MAHLSMITLVIKELCTAGVLEQDWGREGGGGEGPGGGAGPGDV